MLAADRNLRCTNVGVSIAHYDVAKLKGFLTQRHRRSGPTRGGFRPAATSQPRQFWVTRTAQRREW